MGEVISKQPGDSEFTRREPHTSRKSCQNLKKLLKKSESKVKTAIMIALDKRLCKKSDLDLSFCRESIVLPGKILLFNKKGLKAGLVAV